jgi:hypothetical protein
MLSRFKVFIIIKNRISVSLVGSLVPIDYAQKLEEGVLRQACGICLTQSIAEAARLQAWSRRRCAQGRRAFGFPD